MEVYNLSLKQGGNASGEKSCSMYPIPYITTQFYLVFVVGSSFSVLSLMENVLLLVFFMRKPKFREKHYFYLMFLSVLDIFNAISYLLVFSLCIYFEYQLNWTLMRLWYAYVIPAFTFAHVIRCAGSFLIVAVSLERYFSANMFSEFWTVRKRIGMVLVVCFLSIFFRGTTMVEITVKHRPYCEGLAEYIIVPTAFMKGQFGKIWTFWIRNIAVVIIPFVMCIYLNIGIVYKDKCACITVDHEGDEVSTTETISDVGFNKKKKMRFKLTIRRPFKTETNYAGSAARMSQAEAVELAPKPTLTNEWVRRARNRVQRAATRTLIAIISTFATVWEYVDPDSLGDNMLFYTVSADMVSQLTVIASAGRLPTYLSCDHKFRNEFIALFCSCLPTKAKRRQQLLTETKIMKEQNKRRFSAIAFTALLNKNEDESPEGVKGEPGVPAPTISARTLEILTRKSPAMSNGAAGSGGFRGFARAVVAAEKAKEDAQAAKKAATANSTDPIREESCDEIAACATPTKSSTEEIHMSTPSTDRNLLVVENAPRVSTSPPEIMLTPFETKTSPLESTLSTNLGNEPKFPSIQRFRNAVENSNVSLPTNHSQSQKYWKSNFKKDRKVSILLNTKSPGRKNSLKSISHSRSDRELRYRLDMDRNSEDSETLLDNECEVDELGCNPNGPSTTSESGNGQQDMLKTTRSQRVCPQVTTFCEDTDNECVNQQTPGRSRSKYSLD